MALAAFDRQEVDRFAQVFEELFYRGDAATMTSFYTQHAMIMAPDSEAVRGRRAAAARLLRCAPAGVPAPGLTVAGATGGPRRSERAHRAEP